MALYGSYTGGNCQGHDPANRFKQVDSICAFWAIEHIKKRADLATFGRIKELYKQGLTTDAVREALPLIQPEAGPGDHALITLSDFAQHLEYIQSFNAKLKAQVDEQAELIKAMKERIDHLEQPWYKRILSPKSAPKSWFYSLNV